MSHNRLNPEFIGEDIERILTRIDLVRFGAGMSRLADRLVFDEQAARLVILMETSINGFFVLQQEDAFLVRGRRDGEAYLVQRVTGSRFIRDLFEALDDLIDEIRRFIRLRRRRGRR